MSEASFGGSVGRTWQESTAWWPPDPSPPAGAPNVVLVVLDDVGYAQLGCFGSDIETPALDQLAAGGVWLANFHTTGMCSSTRASLFTGRNHHSNAMGRAAELATGFPGYSGHIPRSNGFMSEILGQGGYLPLALGKWHLTPADETHQAARRDSWPCGRGFQRWYGFHGPETNQFVPSLFQDNHSVVAPEAPEHAYHLSTDLADRAIRYLGELRSVDVKSPFFMYFAPGAGHAPHQAPGDWIAHYAGRFDDGWDAWRERAFLRQLDLGLFPETTVMVPRPHWIPAWESFDPDERLVSARLMECFAGFLSHADAQIGRVFDFIRTLGEWDKTLVIAVSDNGASGEGGPRGSINGRPARDAAPSDRADRLARMDEIGGPTAHNNYPWGWAMAGNTPFRRWKGEVHEGGVIAPAIVSWPSRLPGGGPPRRQFTHAIDILPTVLDLIGMEAPAEIGGVSQARIEGTSFASVLGDPEASEPHPIQYFEMMGSRAIYHQGWKAVTFHPFVDVYQEGRDPALPFDDDVWELYDLADDPTEAHDRARSDRERLDTMVDLWWTEAGKYQVLPLDNRLKGSPHPHSGQPPGPTQVIWPFGAPIPQSQVLDLRHRSHSLNASVVIPPGGAEGVLIALGTVLGGWSFHLLDGHLRYENRFVANGRDVIVSPERVAPGPRTLAWQFTADGTAGGHGVMLVDGYPVAEGRLEPVQSAGDDDETGGGVTCGYEQGPAVGEGYTAPHTFSGVLHWVVLGLEEDGRVRP